MDEDQFYSDDAMQGQEGGFEGYNNLENTPSYGQNDYTPYGDFNQGQGWQQSFEPGSLQSMFGQKGLYSNPEQSIAPNVDIYGSSTNFNNLPQGNLSPTSSSWGDTLTKMLGGLGGLFSQQQGQRQGASGAMNSTGLGSIISALLSGKQNTQNATQAKNIINQQQASTDPFASQRPFYQQQLQQAVSNPYSPKIVSDQVTALKNAQARKDAAAGRRSNSATSDPELLRAMADIAQKYQSSLYQPAGALFRPDMTGYRELLDANRQQTNGYISPLLSALGFNQQSNNNSANMESTLGNLVKVLQTMQQGQGAA